MKYAVIKTGGKQYKVSEGDIIEVERMETQPDETVTFPEVLLYTSDGVSLIGQPVVEGVVVSGKVLANMRGEKIRVAKYKAKVRYRRVTGHRQELTQVRIDSISDGKKAPKKEAVKEKVTEKTESVKAAAK